LAKSFSQICVAVENIISKKDFEYIIIQGDTTTACAISKIAFYNQVKIAHVEAGLRTYDLANPFPEEANRRIISVTADINFAPTKYAFNNLKREGAKNIYLTGNTIVDALNYFEFDISFDNLILITLHRRENHKQIKDIFMQLNRAAADYPDIEFIFPIHPNPNVQKYKNLLKGDNFRIIEPLGYPEMLGLMSRASGIISDSGGLQEEAVYFGKRILIIRKVTERPETVEAGFGKLVDKNIVKHLDWALTKSDPPRQNPFGDGRSCERIVEVFKQ